MGAGLLPSHFQEASSKQNFLTPVQMQGREFSKLDYLLGIRSKRGEAIMMGGKKKVMKDSGK